MLLRKLIRVKLFLLEQQIVLDYLSRCYAMIEIKRHRREGRYSRLFI